MAILKDKYGNWCNTDYKFAIQCCPFYPNKDTGFRCWFKRGRYKTEQALLQALNQLKENEKNCTNRCKMSPDGGKTWHEAHWLFKPVHLNYEFLTSEINI